MLKGGVVFFVLVVLFSCAQQNQPLTGGLQDTIAPKLVKSMPAMKDTGFSEEKIIIKFNEYFTLENIDANFFSSPPFAETPKFKVARKKIIIKFNEELKDSVTYTFKFGNSISDLNEKNKIKQFEFIFSTYSEIDTLQISGSIKDAYTFAPITDAIVMLYDNNIDSLPTQELPLYAAKTDTSGNFTISNIKSINYKIFALLDLNGNFIFDEDENQIAFQDSLVFPYAKLITNYDTLDSGTVVTRILQDTLLNDTLLHDSVIISHQTEYFPKNINLLFYTEKGEKQEIKRKLRTLKGCVKIFFTKQIINDFLTISPINEADSHIFDNITENFASKDSVFFWFTNKDFYDNDTLKFSINYFINDSIKTVDTLIFSNYNYATDTLPLKIKQQKNNISIFENLSFISDNPIRKIDSVKANLYKIVDTIVDDAKEQNVAVYRPAYDSLIFIFDRATDKFQLEFDNYKDSANVYSWKKNTTSDSVFCKIHNYSLIEKDTFFLRVFYDNLFFFNQLVGEQKDFIIPISFQKIKKTKRPTQDTLLFVFQKDLIENPEIELVNFSETDFNYSINKNILTIKLINNNAKRLDTLDFVVKLKDMRLLNGTVKNYEDTIKSIYVFDKQRITYSRRYFRSKMIFAFKKPLLATPEFELLSFNPLKKWYSLNTNAIKDTVFIDIYNERVKRLNNMRLSVKYFDINQHNDTLWFSDTLSLKILKAEENKVEIIGREIPLTLNEPLDFVIEQDSNSLRKYYVDANYQPSYNYSFVIDSATTTDIYSNVNDTVVFDFKVFAPENFAGLILEIQNIWTLIDSIETPDTNVFFKLPKGQAILIIEDENSEIYKTSILKSDKTLKDAMFLPGRYTLRIYYDENSNNTWDVGNYFKHIQPEKMFIYKNTLNLAEGTEQKIIWNLLE